MAKTIDQMSEDELIAEITRLQATRVPSSKPAKQTHRLDERRKKDPAKRTWRDDLFGED